MQIVLRLRNLVSTPWGSAGVDALTTAGLETGATFRSSQNHAVTAPGKSAVGSFAMDASLNWNI